MKISVIGTGYVGLVSGVCLAAKGHQVIVLDKRQDIIDKINRAEAPIYEPGLGELLEQTVHAGNLKASYDLAKAFMATDLSIITVGTPFKGDKIDLSHIEEVSREVGELLKVKKQYHVICVKSTVVPTTTDTVVKNILEKASGKKAGEFGLAMNPEFLREGMAVQDFMQPDRIVIGAYDTQSFEKMKQVYKGLFDAPMIRVNLRTAEMIKYTSNALLAGLISYSNEIAAICEQIGEVDVREVLEGVSRDKRFSPKEGQRVIQPEMNKYLRAGCGFGGSCFPKDVKALIAFSREKGYVPRMIQSIVEINENQPIRVTQRLETELGNLFDKKLVVLGVAFKPDTDDVRESPALIIIDQLLKKKAHVYVVDPIALDNARQVLPLNTENLFFTTDYKVALQNADAAVLVTSWPEFLAIEPGECMRLMKTPIMMDGRRVYDQKAWENAGVKYLGIGLTE